MKQQFVAKTFEIAADTPDFYMDVFSNCTFVLKGGSPSFLMCDFLECTFAPPYLEEGQINPRWDDLMAGCSVSGPKVQALLKPADLKAMALPKIESPCRRDPAKPCYVPEKCVFNCKRSER